MPEFIRLALWAGPRKGKFVAAIGVVVAVLGVFCLFLTLPVTPPLLFWLGVAVVLFLGGAAFGWFMWQGYIWPAWAAFPGSVWYAPSIKPYEALRGVATPSEGTGPHDAA